jgi:D-aspartate ligase
MITADPNSLIARGAESRSLKKPIGALVVGGDYQGLGIVRSLGRQNVPVCVLDDETSIARFSRYTTHAIAVKSLLDERQAADTILDIGHRLDLEGWVVYPTRDETVAALARYRSKLAEFFRVPTPHWDTIQWVWDKRNTYRLASELGIPTPRTWYLHDVSELEQINTDPPYAIKPAIKEHFIYATKAKAWRANNRAELRELFQRAAAQVGPGEVMIQELIPGDLPLLETLSERFLRAINYYGLAELEYKLDPRDGQYKLLDVNGRTWGYHTLGAGAGVDFPYLLFADQVGESVQPCRAQAGVRWIRLITDVPTSVMEILGRRQGFRAYLGSIRQVNVESVFSRDDPFPGFIELALIPYLFVKRGF